MASFPPRSWVSVQVLIGKKGKRSVGSKLPLASDSRPASSTHKCSWGIPPTPPKSSGPPSSGCRRGQACSGLW